MRFLKYISIATIFALGIYFVVIRNNPYQEISGKAFGTYYNIKIRTENKNRELPLKIKNELNKINQEMSVFEPDSEINKINALETAQTIEISDNMNTLLSSAKKIHHLTNGNFDPTVGPLVELWGFGTVKQNLTPTTEQIQATLKNIGFDKIKLNNKTLSKQNHNLMINLSAIAKGYAVDRISNLLQSEGYKNYVIEIGGEVYASGSKSDTTKGWTIGVASPTQDSQTTENSAIVILSNMAVATSGDYRNYYYKDNKRYSHTISPQTGYPVEHNLASVTVFDSNCMNADAIATGIMAMGETKGLKFANQNKIPAIFFIRNEKNEIELLLSKQGQELLSKQGIILSSSPR